MNELGSQRSRAWDIYGSSNPSPSQTGVDREGAWKNFGTSMSAISIGFVATAILISMFLIMAIFEHLFRPALQDVNDGPRPTDKLRDHEMVATSYAPDFSVLMPGQNYPTFIAQPAPLPCTREGIYWPSHEQHLAVS